MRIISLTAENIKRLKAVTIKPSEDVVLITGKNAAGKSSVLDSIVMALGGKEQIPEEPIRQGQETAKIVLDLGEMVVERRFTATGSYLEVKTKDGFKAKSPQQLLDNLVGKISFDPLAFINELDPKKQRKIVCDLVGLNLDAQDFKIVGLRDLRRDVGRDRDALLAQIKGMTVPPADLPLQEISVANLSAEVRKAIEHNNSIVAQDNAVNQLGQTINDKTSAICKIETQIIELQNQHKQMTTELVGIKATWAAQLAILNTMQKIDTVVMTTQISSAEATNTAIRNAQDYYAKREAGQKKEDEYDSLTKQIETAESEKVTLLSQAKMPLEGLSITEAGVTYKGIPIEQISSAEKLKVGVAMSMALNPKLRVLRITDGSLLDGDNLKAIAEMVKDKDYQIWVEKVTDGAGVGVYIEDGEVK